jgi:hypothetical protein
MRLMGAFSQIGTDQQMILAIESESSHLPHQELEAGAAERQPEPQQPECRIAACTAPSRGEIKGSSSEPEASNQPASDE